MEKASQRGDLDLQFRQGIIASYFKFGQPPLFCPHGGKNFDRCIVSCGLVFSTLCMYKTIFRSMYQTNFV